MHKKAIAIIGVWSLVVGSISLPETSIGQTAEPAPQMITAADIGAQSEDQINNAAEEITIRFEKAGTLIEIGNTTAPETTIVVRLGKHGDKTIEIDTQTTSLFDANGKPSDLNQWIPGDSLQIIGTENTNSGSIKADKIYNKSIRGEHRAINGWITKIDTDAHSIEVKTVEQKVVTLNVKEARIVAGRKNPAVVSDLKISDRIRSRVVEDKDGNVSTWNAKIVVVLRRKDELFMKVSRWVTPGVITFMPATTTIPTTITFEILPNRFYQERDVNNLVGAPGESVNVYISEQTKLRRRYLGEALLSEFNVGDEIQVIGRLNDQTGNLDAEFIKNISIQTLGFVHLFGTVESVDAASSSFTVDHILKHVITDIWTINVLSETEIHKGDVVITLAKLKPGDRVKVKGIGRVQTKEVDAHIVSVLMQRHEEAKSRVVKIESIEIDKGIISGKRLDRGDIKVEVLVNAETKIYRDEKEIKISELNVGERIKVTGKIVKTHDTETITAERIYVTKSEHISRGLGVAGKVSRALEVVSVHSDYLKTRPLVRHDEAMDIGVSAETKIYKAETEIKIDDIKPGNLIKVSGEFSDEDRRINALVIRVTDSAREHIGSRVKVNLKEKKLEKDMRDKRHEERVEKKDKRREERRLDSDERREERRDKRDERKDTR